MQLSPDDPTVRWLLEREDPAIRLLVLTDLLGKSGRSREVREALARAPSDPRIRTLLAGQRADGGFGVHPYQKWTGAHWRLVSLVELGLPPGHPAALRAIDTVLGWLGGADHRKRIVVLRGRVRRCASQEGNALAVASRLGMAEDPRVRKLASCLVDWQWPDGGWNCDKDPRADHSSFYESLAPMWGLLEHYRATGDRDALIAAERAREMVLRHRLFRSEETGDVIKPKWLELHYPLYWHYDVLQALTILSRFGSLGDPRLREALDVVEGKRLPDGRWRVEASYWHPPGKGKPPAEVVDWGRTGPNKMITLNALRVLRATGRVR